MNVVAAIYDNDRRQTADATSPTRGKTRLAWNAIFRVLRLIRKYVQNAYLVFGIFLLAGAAVAVFCTWAFTELAGNVRSGTTQAFDETVMRWVGAHQNPSLQKTMLEITSLGTGTVVAMIVFIAGMFL